MTEYRIKISYRTGDSFHNEDTERTLELTWNNLDIAKENLQRIKEHYEMYKGCNNHYSKPTREQWYEQNKNKVWFVNKPKLYCISSDCAIDDNEKTKKAVGKGNWEYRPDSYFAEQCLYLKADNGNEMQLSAFWCGYFESLYGAEIELNNSDMKISF